ncbi:3-keto-5-aminohexanoate cleavage protein [Haloglycomyces albus]|uniref:3-keto-5-aminohexanoate cleavage protein n=1 Tax=Haloglycomyces albus TaxID=526067 RepID=UPI0004A278AB|nr:3-keto-5-aminohexanoate cleavage protein [Haloglycomyces albus]
MSQGFITVAPTGAEVSKSDCPPLPVTIDELVAAATDCQAAGASIIHVHIRDDDATSTLDLQRLKDTVSALRESCDLVIQLSTGGAVTDAEPDRLAVLEAEPDMASCTMGSVNFGDDVFFNRWGFVRRLHQAMQDHGVVPEYEIFDLGHLSNLARLLEKDGLPHGGHVHVDFVLGVPGGASGDPATVADMTDAVNRYLPEGTTFSATGIGRTTMPVMLSSVAAGGHLRVGLEDTTSYRRGERAESNAQLVRRAADVLRIAGREVATPADTRRLLSIA